MAHGDLAKKDNAMNINEIKNKAGLGLEKVLTEKNASAKSSEIKLGVAQTDAKTRENVTLSPMSAQLKSISSDVATSGVFDTEKVEAIKSAIAKGQFKVDSEKVADGLIDTVTDLLKNK